MPLDDMSLLPEYDTPPMTIWKFLDWKKAGWTSSKTLCVDFRVIGEYGVYRYVSVGKHPPRDYDYYMDVYPGKYFVVDGIGGLMGELMDLSVQFNLYKIYVKRSFDYTEYTVWLHRLEQGQETNIDADMVENFSKKVCGND
jgi:hypothetical protein